MSPSTYMYSPPYIVWLQEGLADWLGGFGVATYRSSVQSDLQAICQYISCFLGGNSAQIICCAGMKLFSKLHVHTRLAFVFCLLSNGGFIVTLGG